MLPTPPIQPEPDPVIIDASDAFMSPADQKAQPQFPQFTREELEAIGVTFVATEKTRLLTIPLKAQKFLMESVKGFGFGMTKALDPLLQRILALFEIKGSVNFHTPDGTFDLCASQGIQLPKTEAGPTPTPDKEHSGPPKFLIGLVGLRRSGKDTAAAALESKDCGYTNFKFAGALKCMLHAYLIYRGATEDLAAQMIDGDLKETTTTLFAGWTPRYAMQTLGTEWARNLLSNSFWVDTLIGAIQGHERVVVSDVRFPNEADAIRKAGGKIIKIRRPGASVDGHASEALIESINADAIIMNDEGIEQLRKRVIFTVTNLYATA